MSTEFHSPSVSDTAVEAFYTEVASRHAPFTPWSELSDDWRAFYKDLMVTAVDKDLPVSYRWTPDWLSEGRPKPIFETATAYEHPASAETDRLIATKVLGWELDGDNVLIPNRRMSEPSIAVSVPDQWSPTLRLADAETLLHWLAYWDWTLHLDDDRRGKYQDRGWWFELCRVDLNPDEPEDDAIPTHYWELDGGGETLQLAICRAALHAAEWMNTHPDQFKEWHECRERGFQHDPWH